MLCRCVALGCFPVDGYAPLPTQLLACAPHDIHTLDSLVFYTMASYARRAVAKRGSRTILQSVWSVSFTPRLAPGTRSSADNLIAPFSSHYCTRKMDIPYLEQSCTENSRQNSMARPKNAISLSGRCRLERFESASPGQASPVKRSH